MTERLNCRNRPATTALHRAAVQLCPLCAPTVRAISGTHPRRRPGTMSTMTSLPAGYRTVDVPQSRHRDLLVLDTWAFPSTVTEDQLEALPMSLTWDRARAVVGLDAATARALWGVLLDLDLMATVETWLLALDDPLWFLLVDPRAAQPRISDNLWIRLLDVPTALAARRYTAPVDVVLEVTDERLPANAGRWRLVGGADGAQVTRANASADLSIGVRELGSAYLGGVSLAALAGAGLVTEHTPGALRQAAVAFGWPVLPVCSWIW